MSNILEDFRDKKVQQPKDGYMQCLPDNTLPPCWTKDEYRRYNHKKTRNLITDWKNEKGELTHYTERLEPDETSDGKKKIIPWTYFYKQLDDNKVSNIWKQKKWEGNKCFYNSHLIPKSDKPIVVVEGEKCLHFVNNHSFLSKHYLATTWYGGVNNIYDFNFDIFKDKEVVLCPDNDEPGKDAMHTIAYILINNQITDKIKYFRLAELNQSSFPEGWDLADPMHKDFKIEEVLNPGSLYITKYESVLDKSRFKAIKETLKLRSEENTAQTLLDKYYYVMANDMFIEQGGTDFLLKQQINNFHKHQNRNLSEYLLSNPEFKKAKTFITSGKYLPGLIEVGVGEIPRVEPGIVLNIYKPNHIKPKPGDVSFLINFYVNLIGEKKWRIIEKWIAYLVQNPGIKMKWAVVLVSEIEGTGKGLLARIISRIKGFHNVNENANFKHLINSHNTLLVGTEVIVLNEISLGDYKSKAEGTNSLKNFVADDTYSCNFKNKPMVVLPNTTNFLLFSNDVRVLGVNNGQRRYFFNNIKITEQEIIKISNEGFFDKAWQFVDSDEGASNLLHYFKNEVVIDDLEIFKRRAPQTDDLVELIEQSKHPVIKKLEYELKLNLRSPIFDKYFSGLISFEELNKKMSTRNTYGENIDWGSYGDDALYKFLSLNGTPWNDGNMTKQIEIYGHKVRYYNIDDSRCPVRDKSYKDLTPKQIRIILSSYRTIKSFIRNQEKIFNLANERIQKPFDTSHQPILQKLVEQGLRTDTQIVDDFSYEEYEKIKKATGFKDQEGII